MSDRKSPVNGAELPTGQPFEAGDEARANGKKGGLKSGAVRRAKKTLKEELLYLLNVDVGEAGQARTAISTSLIEQAINGNVRAFEIIRDTIGEKPTEKVNVVKADYTALDDAFAQLDGREGD